MTATSRLPALATLWALWVLFIVYGSLVPLEPRALDFAAAWRNFRELPFLRLGVASRADWIANGVLYLPLGLLSAQWAWRLSPAALRVPALALSLAGCLLLALAVEFAQQFFPPRTVSLNDLLAEGLGSLLGVLLAGRALSWGRALHAALATSGPRLRGLLLDAYPLAYLALALFPYDLLLGAGEFRAKLAGPLWGLLLAPAALEGSSLRLLARLLVEAALALPLGLWLARHRPGLRAPGVLGIALGAGVALELAQFCIASGISQGASVLARAPGLLAGWGLARHGGGLDPGMLQRGLRRLTLPALLVYLPALPALHGWFSAPWLSATEAVARLPGVRWLPFYYHYYSTEAQALLSLGSNALLYAPLGLLAWAHRAAPAGAAAAALACAGIVEAGKLALPGRHPDPTNLLIAVSAAWGVQRLLLLLEASRSGAAEEKSGKVADGAVRRGRPAQAAGAWDWLRVVPLLAFAAWSSARFPVAPMALLLGLGAAGLLAWWRPAAVPVLAMAALPALDLAPWSGRFFWTEFDLLLLVTLSLAWVRTAPAGGLRLDAVVLAGALMMAGLLVAAARGLTPLQWPQPDSFASYHSPYNALRILKGAVWALLLLALLRRLAAAGTAVAPLLGRGLVLGLGLVVLCIVWERAAFPGLFDMAAPYRVSGPFSVLHKGGGQAEAFIAMALPFALLWALAPGPAWQRAAKSLLAVGAGYAALMTFSRAGHAAFLVALLLGLAVALWRRQGEQPRTGTTATARALTVAVAGVAALVLGGPFARERLARTGADLQARLAHWQQVLAWRAPGWEAQLLGAGLGRYPATHLIASEDGDRGGSYRLVEGPPQRHLRLGAGTPLYFEQAVPATAAVYRLRLRWRALEAGGGLGVALCEKWLLSSMRCVQGGLAGVAPGAWTEAELLLDRSGLAPRPGPLGRPLRLALFHAAGEGAVDVARVKLVDAATDEPLLHNGDFAAGLDRWYFTTDDFRPWNIDNLGVALLFEQGWLGLAAWALGMAGALAAALAGLRRGDRWAGACAVALAAFLITAGFNTLIDDARQLMLVLVVAWLPALRHWREEVRVTPVRGIAAPKAGWHAYVQ